MGGTNGRTHRTTTILVGTDDGREWTWIWKCRLQNDGYFISTALCWIWKWYLIRKHWFENSVKPENNGTRETDETAATPDRFPSRMLPIDWLLLKLVLAWNSESFLEHSTISRTLRMLFLAATKQLYEWYFLSVCPSVRLSVCLSVCHTFLTMFPSSYHHEIFRSYHIGPG